MGTAVNTGSVSQLGKTYVLWPSFIKLSNGLQLNFNSLILALEICNLQLTWKKIKLCFQCLYSCFSAYYKHNQYVFNFYRLLNFEEKSILMISSFYINFDFSSTKLFEINL